MAEVVRMPKMSDTMTEGVIVEWHKKVGDKVKPGDVIADIETDKAVMEFESFQDGTLLYIGADKGATVKVNDIIAVLGKEGEEYKSLLSENGSAEKESAEKQKAEMTPPSEKAEKPKEEASVKTKETTKQQPAPRPESAETGKQQTTPQREYVQVAKPASAEDGKIKASPLAKKIAGDSGVPIDKLKGSGDEGRIVKRDVEKYLAEKPKTPSAISGEESYEDVPVSMMRKTIARRLSESKFSSPEFYLTTEINMDRCVDAREAINKAHPDSKISFNDIIIKATALALKQHPKVNSSWLTDVIRVNHHVHIGMAVAVEEGLLVPVIRFSDQKSLSQIHAEAKEFAAKAKEKKLQPEEMQGNTFTISNLGMMDIDEFTAIINPPDSCILAIGKIKQTPVVEDEEIKVANILKVTMSCDHRVVDGATGAAFLQTLKAYLEIPLQMMY